MLKDLIKKSLFASLCVGSFSTQLFAAKTCDLSIEGNDQMQYSTKELRVAADCTDVKLTLKHTGKLPKAAMGHNWVLSKAADMQGVVGAAMGAGLANDYVPKDDARVLAKTTLVGGGESTSVTFSLAKLKAGEDYQYFCTFPGHSAIMNGRLIIEGAAAAAPKK